MVSPARPGETTARSQVIEMFTLLYDTLKSEISLLLFVWYSTRKLLATFMSLKYLKQHSYTDLYFFATSILLVWNVIRLLPPSPPPLTPTARGWRRVTYCFSPFLNRPYCTVPQMIQYSLVYLHSQRNSGIPVQSKNSFCWKWVQQACPHRGHFCYSSWSTF